MKERYMNAAAQVAEYWRKRYDDILPVQKQKALAECNYNYLVYLAFYAELEAVLGNDMQAKRALLDLGAFRTEFIIHCKKAFPHVVFPDRESDFPVLEPRFSVSHYMHTIQILEQRGQLSAAEHALAEEYAVSGVNQAFTFLDWGTHNRGIMRAVNLMLAAQTFPQHANAGLWRQTAENIMRDNRGAWSIEDTPNYFPIWLHDLWVYADLTGDCNVVDPLKTRYYLDMLLKLLNPCGYISDYGDDTIGVKAAQIAVLERGAAVYDCGRMKYAADVLFAGFQLGDVSKEATLRGIGTLLHAYLWADDTIVPERPVRQSCEIHDDLVGKKLLFASEDENAPYLLLNYRDEGDYGWLTRNFLRTTLTVQPEKMHHGHSDENSIVCLIHNKQLLLGDGGYRELENPHGEYRADYYHNGLIVRKGRPAVGEDPLAFSVNRGEYERVRSKKLYFYRFADWEVSRTRVYKALGCWDRCISYLKAEELFVITDIFVPNQDGVYTLFPLYFPESGRLQIGFFGEGDTFQSSLTRRGEQQTAVYRAHTAQLRQGDSVIFHTVLSVGAPVAAQNFGERLELRTSGGVHTLITPVNTEICLDGVEVRPAYRFADCAGTYGDFQTDALYLAARVTEQRLSYALVNATRLDYCGKQVFGSLPVQDFNEFNRVQGWKIKCQREKSGIDTYWNCFSDQIELKK